MSNKHQVKKDFYTKMQEWKKKYEVNNAFKDMIDEINEMDENELQKRINKTKSQSER